MGVFESYQYYGWGTLYVDIFLLQLKYYNIETYMNKPEGEE